MNQAEELTKVCQTVAERSSRILGEFAQKQAQNMSAAVRDEMGIAKAFMDLYSRMAADPAAMASLSMSMWVDYARLWQSTWMKMMGVQAQPVAEPVKGDSRFKDEDWSSNFLFDYFKQSYLIAARHIQHAVSEVGGLSPESEKKVAFFTRQYVDALSPSNFLMTNPQVLRETLASGGQNLVRGLNNLLSDIEKGGGELRISMTDESAFKLGRNIATTPGKVVYQNDLMQLIQYQPATGKAYKRPLVIIPPWINKYYILDLRDKNSFIRFAVEQGHTVFVISWVNPDARLAQKGFDDYMLEGPLAALDAVEKATGERKANIIGYCLGGTLLGATLSYLTAKNEDRIGCATFFVSLLDFSKPGELGVFIDEAQVENLERKMNERGYLEGSEMAGTFNLLRANDLVWSFVVNNYLMGKDPFPFDLLYWNADSTRMPARMHSFYLRNMYIKNLLGVPGGITLAGVPIDRRHRQPAGGAEVPILGERRPARDARGVVRRRKADSRLLVERLAGLDGQAKCRGRESACTEARRPAAQSPRGRPGQLRDASPFFQKVLDFQVARFSGRTGGKTIVKPARQDPEQERYGRHLPRDDGQPSPGGDGARDAARRLVGGQQEGHAVAVDLGHRRVDVSGADADYGNAAAAEFGAQAFQPADGRRLGGAVGAGAREAAKAGDAGDARQRAAPRLAHRGGEGGQRRGEAGDVDVEHAPQLLHILDVVADGSDRDPGAGDDQVRRAEPVEEVPRSRRERTGVGDIHRVGDGFSRQVEAVRAAPGNQAQHSVRGRVVPRQRLSDAGGGAGDDDAHYFFRSAAARPTRCSTTCIISRTPPAMLAEVRYLPSTTKLGTPFTW